jgi:hypothetical protein
MLLVVYCVEAFVVRGSLTYAAAASERLHLLMWGWGWGLLGWQFLDAAPERSSSTPARNAPRHKALHLR